MSVIEIREAEVEGARSVTCFAGVSGSGKTVTAILFAYGLANYDPSKVGLLDSENRRGRLNARVLKTLAKRPTDKKFLIADLYPPFSPQRYIEAIQEFQAAGVKVLVIDSASHEWEGTGGCEEIAYEGNPRLPAWNRAKAQHKRFMNAALQCDMDIVFCVRAREKAKPEVVNGKTVYVSLGLQPIAEKNFMFDMTASVMMRDQGAAQDVIKCPAELQGILGRGAGYITDEDGKALRDYLDGAKQIDQRVERFRNALLSKTEGGAAIIEECWTKTPADVRESLGDAFQKQLFSAAAAYDSHRADASKADGPADDGATAAAIMAQATAAPAETVAEKPPAEKPAEAKKPHAPAAAKPAPAPAKQPEPKAPAKADVF